MRAEEALNSFNDKNKTNITNLYTIELESTIKRLLDFIENKTTCKDSKGMKKIIASSRKILSSNHNRSKNRYAKSIH
jgi:hypothetical protein